MGTLASFDLAIAACAGLIHDPCKSVPSASVLACPRLIAAYHGNRLRHVRHMFAGTVGVPLLREPVLVSCWWNDVGDVPLRGSLRLVFINHSERVGHDLLKGYVQSGVQQIF